MNEPSARLEDVLRRCTSTNNGTQSEQEKVIEQLWKEQSERLEQHKQYLSESMEIQPVPEFVAKAKLRAKDQSPTESIKVFLNICSHHMIPTLSISQIDVNQNGKAERGIRFPMSCGPRIAVKDAKGNDAWSYDVVFHPEIIQTAMDDAHYKLNVVVTAAQNLSQKEDIVIEGPFKFPNLSYKGSNPEHTQPLPQRIRKKGAAKFVQEEEPQNKYYPLDDRKENVLSIESAPKKKEEPKSAESTFKGLDHDFYILFHDKDRKKEKGQNVKDLKRALTAIEDKGAVSGIQIAIDLTREYTLDDVELDSNENGLYLKSGGMVTIFKLEWRQIGDSFRKNVQWEEVKAKYIKKKNVLKITCPMG